MNKTQRLIRLAAIFSIKLANIDAENVRDNVTNAIITALRNATSTKSLGIMPFEEMAKQDGLNLVFDITRTDGWGTIDISVDNIEIRPSEKASLLPKYLPLKTQIENYLTRNWELYPISQGGEKINYKNFIIRMNINPNPDLTTGPATA